MQTFILQKTWRLECVQQETDARMLCFPHTLKCEKWFLKNFGMYFASFSQPCDEWRFTKGTHTWTLVSQRTAERNFNGFTHRTAQHWREPKHKSLRGMRRPTGIRIHIACRSACGWVSQERLNAHPSTWQHRQLYSHPDIKVLHKIKKGLKNLVKSPACIPCTKKRKGGNDPQGELCRDWLIKYPKIQ